MDMKTLATMFLLLLINKGIETKIDNDTLLVLRSPLNKQFFSKFKIFQFKDCIVAVNNDSDYSVPEGIYMVEATSNNFLYNKKVMVEK